MSLSARKPSRLAVRLGLSQLLCASLFAQASSGSAVRASQPAEAEPRTSLLLTNQAPDQPTSPITKLAEPPELPVLKSPVDYFRELLALERTERTRLLADRPRAGRPQAHPGQGSGIRIAFGRPARAAPARDRVALVSPAADERTCHQPRRATGPDPGEGPEPDQISLAGMGQTASQRAEGHFGIPGDDVLYHQPRGHDRGAEAQGSGGHRAGRPRALAARARKVGRPARNRAPEIAGLLQPVLRAEAAGEGETAQHTLGTGTTPN